MDRLDPLDREIIKDRRSYRKRRTRQVRLSWRSMGCVLLLAALLATCGLAGPAYNALMDNLNAWRNPTPTPRPTIPAIEAPTPPIMVITPKAGNDQPVAPDATRSAPRPVG